MTEREIDHLLWGAYLLGARVVASQNGMDLGAKQTTPRLLNEVSRPTGGGALSLENVQSQDEGPSLSLCPIVGPG